jgi:hypothetical protein
MQLRISHLLLPVALIISSTSPAIAADNAPPQLVDWNSGGGADITNSDGQVKANFILSDDSEIELPKLILKSLTTTQMTSFATVKVIQKSGKLTSYEATAVVQKGQAARTWEWILYPLGDSLGNRSTIFGPGANWNGTVAIYNSEYTGETASCERAVTSWNTQIERLEAAEKKFFGYEDFSVLRLKFYPPIIKVDQTFCATKPVDLATVLGLANSATGLGVDLSEVLDRVTAKRQEAADNAASNPRIAAAKIKYSELNSEIDRLIKQYPSKKSEIELYKKKMAIFERIDQVNVTNVELNLAGIESKLVAMRSVYGKIARTITCTKGKLTKKVTDVNPKCPAGYKKK